MSAISTHVLDTSRGAPAPGVPVVLEHRSSDGWEALGSGATDADGRARDLGPDEATAGTYRLTFDTGAYFDASGAPGFYPEVAIVFAVCAGQHYHVPLLLNPYGYSTYRGS